MQVKAIEIEKRDDWDTDAEGNAIYLLTSVEDWAEKHKWLADNCTGDFAILPEERTEDEKAVEMKRIDAELAAGGHATMSFRIIIEYQIFFQKRNDAVHFKLSWDV